MSRRQTAASVRWYGIIPGYCQQLLFMMKGVEALWCFLLAQEYFQTVLLNGKIFDGIIRCFLHQNMLALIRCVFL